MKKVLLMILCVVTMLLTGCVSSNELNDIAFVGSVFYDMKGDKNIAIKAEVIDPSASGGGDGGGGGGPQPSSLLLSGEGETSVEAFNQVSDSFERKLYYPHVTVRFFTEKFAAQQLESSMDFLLRDNEVREGAKMVIVKGENADKLYSADTGLADTVADFIEDLAISQPDVMSASVFKNSVDFMRAYYLDGEQPVAGVVEIVKDEGASSGQSGGSGGGQSGGSGSSGGGGGGQSEDKYKIVYSGLAVFKEAKLVGFLDGNETRAYNFVTDNMRITTYTLPFDEGSTDVEVTGSKSKIKVSIQGEKASIKVDIKTTLIIAAEQGKKNPDDSQVLKQIQDKFDETLKSEIENVIKKVQSDYQSDIFGFGKHAHMQDPKKWKEIKDDWDSWFAKADVQVSVKSAVNRSGKIKEPFKLEN